MCKFYQHTVTVDVTLCTILPSRCTTIEDGVRFRSRFARQRRPIRFPSAIPRRRAMKGSAPNACGRSTPVQREITPIAGVDAPGRGGRVRPEANGREQPQQLVAAASLRAEPVVCKLGGERAHRTRPQQTAHAANGAALEALNVNLDSGERRAVQGGDERVNGAHVDLIRHIHGLLPVVGYPLAHNAVSGVAVRCVEHRGTSGVPRCERDDEHSVCDARA